MTPSPVDHDARREQLTRVLLALVAERGLEGASVRAVASAAGVSIGTVQHYFRSKDEMLLFAFRQTGSDLTERAERIARRALSVRAAIRGILLELLPLDARREAEARVGIAFAAHAMTAPRLAGVLRDDLDELRRELADAFAQAKVADPPQAASAAMALVDGLATQLLFGSAAFGADDAVAVLDAHLEHALARRRRRRA
ncbi:TetR/AcrR family transcriptional regulator [Conexibacter woesei]|uniref:Transcriptional regulator, TetR family n=1 Tax=Conexibacter woesei (strain DSM 14684 / CCUG 47730 / CIP 108061 / JCM 11494 / NBRC 100937 / ID131577) TaxID=469383 RepID=D3F617_CONWI|nr:TetR family transcriptional regulator C-terminal domain-containing protein [Conexibacter woesei]ADB48690.1 transcriptional regulator, TetR family [Conexibacter woesei DSM 14684]